MSEEKKKDEKKVDEKNLEEVKKGFEKVNTATAGKKSKKIDPTGRGISMKNWIFIVITIVIAFGAGYYFAFLNSQSEMRQYKDNCDKQIVEYKEQINTYQKKQDAIQNLISK